MKKRIHHISDPLSFQDTIPSEYGFIILDREFVHWPLYHDDAAWKMLTYLLMRANYKRKFWGEHTINPGELVTSYGHMAEDLYKSRDEVKRLLSKLKKINEVQTVRLGNALLIRMPNYLKYMGILKRHVLPAPDLDLKDDLPPPITKESNKYNQLTREKNTFATQNLSTGRGSGFRPIGQILARQWDPEAKPKYNFKEFPPKRAEVEDYVKANGLCVNIDDFYQHYEDSCWCDLNGRRIDGWHFALNRMSKKGEYL